MIEDHQILAQGTPVNVFKADSDELQDTGRIVCFNKLNYTYTVKLDHRIAWRDVPVERVEEIG